MSAPPPGGSPPPQTPPPQYPPQYPPPYPPQGYPPPQPYYPQAAPPPKKDNTLLIIVLVVVVVIVVLAAVAVYAVTLIMQPVTQNQLTVTSVTFTINYPGSLQYFGSSTVSTCTSCPMKVSVFTSFVQTITLTNSDTVEHNVTSVVLGGTSFTIISGDPTSSNPFNVPAGATRSLVLTIQPTTILAGDYAITGILTTV